MLLTSPKRKRRVIALLALALVFAMGFGLHTPAVAVSRGELDALKQRQAQLADEKYGIQTQYDAVRGRISDQTQKLALLTSELEITNAEIENLSLQIVIYTNSVAALENQLNISRQEEQELLARYKARVRAMEENGNFTYLSILFGASSFSDLLTRLDWMVEIMAYDNSLIDAVREAQARTEQAKADMEAEMEELEIVCEQYEKKQTELAAQQAEAQAVLEELSADSAEYEGQLESVNALQLSISGQISDMEYRLAELERIRAEQEAARKAAASKNKGGSNGNNNSNSNGGKWYGDAAGTATGQEIVDYAKTFLGVDYVYGGTSPSGFDCSGLVYYCYKHFGYSVNRTAASLALNGRSVSSDALQVGDILLFTSRDGSYIGHTGLYVGGGQFIHAPRTGDVVKISNLSDAYYTDHYYGARRVVS